MGPRALTIRVVQQGFGQVRQEALRGVVTPPYRQQRPLWGEGGVRGSCCLHCMEITLRFEALPSPSTPLPDHAGVPAASGLGTEHAGEEDTQLAIDRAVTSWPRKICRVGGRDGGMKMTWRLLSPHTRFLEILTQPQSSPWLQDVCSNVQEPMGRTDG